MKSKSIKRQEKSPDPLVDIKNELSKLEKVVLAQSKKILSQDKKILKLEKNDLKNKKVLFAPNIKKQNPIVISPAVMKILNEFAERVKIV